MDKARINKVGEIHITAAGVAYSGWEFDTEGAAAHFSQTEACGWPVLELASMAVDKLATV